MIAAILREVDWIIWQFRAVWRMSNDRWYYLRDAPDWVVGRMADWADDPRAQEYEVALKLARVAVAERDLRVLRMQREAIAAMREIFEEGA